MMKILPLQILKSPQGSRAYDVGELRTSVRMHSVLSETLD